MSGYTKLFSDIVLSSIWREDDSTRIVFITLLALCNRDGAVMASVPGLASAANVTMDDILKALKILESPDKWSRDTENEGRRIEKIDGGWLVLNYLKYRERMSKEERREYWAARKRDARRKQKEQENDSSAG